MPVVRIVLLLLFLAVITPGIGAGICNYIKEYMGLCIGKNTGAMFDNNDKVIGGNATDKALLKFLGKNEMNSLNDIKVIKSQGFNSANKYSGAELENVTVYKGAPERLLGKATKYINENGQVVQIDKDKLNAKIDALADKAMRVLSFAYSQSELVEDTLPDDLVIVGFVGIRDDVRPEARDAIKEVSDRYNVSKNKLYNEYKEDK